MKMNSRRAEQIQAGVNEIWTNIYTIQNEGLSSELGQVAKATIIGYTVKQVLEDVDLFLECTFLAKKMTDSERKYVETELAPKVIEEARAELEAIEAAEKAAEEPISAVEKIKKLTAAIEVLGTSTALESARSELIKARKAIYFQAVAELDTAMVGR